MGIEVCGTRVGSIEVTCIEDVIGHDGIEAFEERALELGRHVIGRVDAAEVEAFCRRLSGSYAHGSGLQSDNRLDRVFLPSGFVNVHIHDAITGELLCGIYDNGRVPVDAASVALAIAGHDPVFEGEDDVIATPTCSKHPGTLGIAIAFRRT